jgi:hypothetical protein
MRETQIKTLKGKYKNKYSQALVAHICNPGYSRGSDQEDINSKPA